MRYFWIIAVLAIVAMSGCATVPVRNAVPQQLVAEAKLSGLEDVRMWGDAPASDFEAFLQANLGVLKQKYKRRSKSGKPLTSNILAISGGADDGAFGAGLLVGWQRAGTRPTFDAVTGISAGALIAPFVFLGADYDDQLASIFTEHVANEIYQANILAGIFGGPALADSGPLAALIRQYVDHELLRRVAEERGKGRLLIVGTTNIDAQRPVYWDMGRLAQRGTNAALEIFRKVLLASASIPGVFPPVHFKVVADGKTYEELHVDGGTTRQLFFSPTAFSFKRLDKALGRKIKRRLYVIRNGKIKPEWAKTKETTVALAERSVATLIKSQSLGDLTRMYVHSRDDNIDFNLIAIPQTFSAERTRPFEHSYMTALFRVGEAVAEGGISWQKAPPGIRLQR